MPCNYFFSLICIVFWLQSAKNRLTILASDPALLACCMHSLHVAPTPCFKIRFDSSSATGLFNHRFDSSSSTRKPAPTRNEDSVSGAVSNQAPKYRTVSGFNPKR